MNIDNVGQPSGSDAIHLVRNIVSELLEIRKLVSYLLRCPLEKGLRGHVDKMQRPLREPMQPNESQKASGPLFSDVQYVLCRKDI